MLDGTGKQLLDLLKRLDAENVTYDQLVDDAKAAVAGSEEVLQGLLSVEGLCDATTLKTPTGRKRRRDRGKKRAGKNGGEASTEENSENSPDSA
jgi:hypothetical protein